MNLYENVKDLADKKNLSIRQVEIKAGLSNGTIGKWKEYGSASIVNVAKVAKALGVTVNTLIKARG